MTLLTYTNGNAHTSPRRLTGTAHLGSHWTTAVRVLRSAALAAVEHAGCRQSATVDRVGGEIIDHLGELDSRALHVLQVVFAVLVRASRNGG